MLSVDEQEISIGADRRDDYAIMYCSDSTWITKMDKKVKESPELFSVIAETENGKTYRFPKRLISIRNSFRKLTDEQKQAASERLLKIKAKQS